MLEVVEIEVVVCMMKWNWVSGKVEICNVMRYDMMKSKRVWWVVVGGVEKYKIEDCFDIERIMVGFGRDGSK